MFTLIGFSQNPVEQIKPITKQISKSETQKVNADKFGSTSDYNVENKISKIDKEMSKLEITRDNFTDAALVDEYNEKINKVKALRKPLINSDEPVIKTK